MKNFLLYGILPLALVYAPNYKGLNYADMKSVPTCFIQHTTDMGYIKENGEYTLGAGYKHGRNVWRLQYYYKGFSLLHTQGAGAVYAREFVPGLTGSLGFGYGFSNQVENRARAHYLQPSVQVFYQRPMWGIGFNYSQTVALNPLQKKEWNQEISLQLSGNVKLYDNLWLGADIQKDIRYSVSASAAVSYLIKNQFYVWLQAQVNPMKYKVGLGYYHDWFYLEAVCGYEAPLGFETGIGAAFTFRGTGRSALRNGQ